MKTTEDMKIESFSSTLSFRPSVTRNIQSKQDIIQNSAKSTYDFKNNEMINNSAFPTNKPPNAYQKLNREIMNLSSRKQTQSNEPKELNNSSIMIVDPVNLNEEETSLTRQK